jgi:hypothetical protein
VSTGGRDLIERSFGMAASRAKIREIVEAVSLDRTPAMDQ